MIHDQTLYKFTFTLLYCVWQNSAAWLYRMCMVGVSNKPYDDEQNG